MKYFSISVYTFAKFHRDTNSELKLKTPRCAIIYNYIIIIPI